MSCDEFDRVIEEGSGEERLRAHSGSCEVCRRRIALVDALRDLPSAPPPPGMDERILAAARRVRRRSVLPVFLRVAAAFLLLAGVAVAVLLTSGRVGEYRPRHLSVVDGGRNGTTDEELVIEEVYGPEAPILTAGGGGRDAPKPR